MVAGMRPSAAVRQPIMVLQAYIDDSYKRNGEFVLAGHIATAESWAKFAKEWEALLPSAGTLASNGNYHFKMSEMAANPERMPASRRSGGLFKITFLCRFPAGLTLRNYGVPSRESMFRVFIWSGVFGQVHFLSPLAAFSTCSTPIEQNSKTISRQISRYISFSTSKWKRARFSRLGSVTWLLVR